MKIHKWWPIKRWAIMQKYRKAFMNGIRLKLGTLFSGHLVGIPFDTSRWKNRWCVNWFQIINDKRDIENKIFILMMLILRNLKLWRRFDLILKVRKCLFSYWALSDFSTTMIILKYGQLLAFFHKNLTNGKFYDVALTLQVILFAFLHTHLLGCF